MGKIALLVYDTVIDLRKDTAISPGMTVKTLGYDEIGDGLSSMYKIHSDDEEDISYDPDKGHIRLAHPGVYGVPVLEDESQQIIYDITQDLTQLQQGIDNNTSSINNLNTIVSSHIGTIANHTNAISSLENSVVNLRGNVQSQNDKIEQIRQQVTDTTTLSQINVLEEAGVSFAKYSNGMKAVYTKKIETSPENPDDPEVVGESFGYHTMGKGDFYVFEDGDDPGYTEIEGLNEDHTKIIIEGEEADPLDNTYYLDTSTNKLYLYTTENGFVEQEEQDEPDPVPNPEVTYIGVSEDNTKLINSNNEEVIPEENVVYSVNDKFYKLVDGILVECEEDGTIPSDDPDPVVTYTGISEDNTKLITDGDEEVEPEENIIYPVNDKFYKLVDGFLVECDSEGNINEPEPEVTYIGVSEDGTKLITDGGEEVIPEENVVYSVNDKFYKLVDGILVECDSEGNIDEPNPEPVVLEGSGTKEDPYIVDRVGINTVFKNDTEIEAIDGAYYLVNETLYQYTDGSINEVIDEEITTRVAIDGVNEELTMVIIGGEEVEPEMGKVYYMENGAEYMYNGTNLYMSREPDPEGLPVIDVEGISEDGTKIIVDGNELEPELDTVYNTGEKYYRFDGVGLVECDVNGDPIDEPEPEPVEIYIGISEDKTKLINSDNEEVWPEEDKVYPVNNTFYTLVDGTLQECDSEGNVYGDEPEPEVIYVGITEDNRRLITDNGEEVWPEEDVVYQVFDRYYILHNDVLVECDSEGNIEEPEVEYVGITEDNRRLITANGDEVEPEEFVVYRVFDRYYTLHNEILAGCDSEGTVIIDIQDISEDNTKVIIDGEEVEPEEGIIYRNVFTGKRYTFDGFVLNEIEEPETIYSGISADRTKLITDNGEEVEPEEGIVYRVNDTFFILHEGLLRECDEYGNITGDEPEPEVEYVGISDDLTKLITSTGEEVEPEEGAIYELTNGRRYTLRDGILVDVDDIPEEKYINIEGLNYDNTRVIIDGEEVEPIYGKIYVAPGDIYYTLDGIFLRECDYDGNIIPEEVPEDVYVDHFSEDLKHAYDEDGNEIIGKAINTYYLISNNDRYSYNEEEEIFVLEYHNVDPTIEPDEEGYLASRSDYAVLYKITGNVVEVKIPDYALYNWVLPTSFGVIEGTFNEETGVTKYECVVSDKLTITKVDGNIILKITKADTNDFFYYV